MNKITVHPREKSSKLIEVDRNLVTDDLLELYRGVCVSIREFPDMFQFFFWAMNPEDENLINSFIERLEK